MLKIIVIIVAVIAFAFIALAVAANMLLSRTNNSGDTPAARSNGEELIKESKVIIAVGAHPDDLEYYTGGTLGMLAGEGETVIGVLTADLSFNQDVRRREATKAAKTLGYIPVFLGHPERDFEGGPTEQDKKEMRAEIIALIKKYNADTLIAYDSNNQGPIYHHVDHIASGIAAQAAAKETNIKNVYLYSSGEPNTRVDTSPATAKKSQAIAAHASQQDRRWIKFARVLFGWIRPSASKNDEHFFGNSESFRKI